MDRVSIFPFAILFGAFIGCNKVPVVTDVAETAPISQPPSTTSEQSTETDDHAAGAREHDGAAIYERYCALCHGPDREGYAADDAPSLRSPELMGRASGSYLWHSISYGRPGTAMAAFADTQGGPLSHDEQHALLDWLMEKAEVEWEPIEDIPIVGNPIQGADVYGNHCASCHGEQGEGGTGTALANGVFLATASDSFIHYTTANGRTGTPMAAYSEVLEPSEINDVVAFIRSRASGWQASEPKLYPPPDPANAIINPESEPAKLDEHAGRFVSAQSVAEAIERGERMVLLDARPMSDWQRSHLPGALPMPFYDGVEALLPHLPNDGTPIIAYCACPHAASGRVVDALIEAGFTSARILDEGVLVWTGRGYPTAVGTAQ